MDLCQYISYIFLLNLHENKEKLPFQVIGKCCYYIVMKNLAVYLLNLTTYSVQDHIVCRLTHCAPLATQPLFL